MVRIIRSVWTSREVLLRASEILTAEMDVCAVFALLEQAESDPQNIRIKLLELAVQLAGECHHFTPLLS